MGGVGHGSIVECRLRDGRGVRSRVPATALALLGAAAFAALAAIRACLGGGAVPLLCGAAVGAAAVPALLPRLRLPAVLGPLIVGVAWFDVAGWAWEVDRLFGPYDDIAHVLTSAAIGLLLGCRLRTSRRLPGGRFAHALPAVVAAATVVVGALWEAGEWPIVKVLSGAEVASDLGWDAAGAALAALAAPWGLRPRRGRPGRSGGGYASSGIVGGRVRSTSARAST